MSLRGGARLAAAALALLPVATHARPAPGSVLAAERAFSDLAQTNGELAAYRAVAAPGAQLLLPRREDLRAALANALAPADPMRRRPQAAWTACDGSAAVVTGRWLARGRGDRFYTAVWVRGRDGAWWLLLEHLAASKPARLAPDGRAACIGQPGLPLAAPPDGADFRAGAARDQTLVWTSAVAPDGTVNVEAQLWDGTAHRLVLRDHAPAPLASRAKLR